MLVEVISRQSKNRLFILRAKKNKAKTTTTTTTTTNQESTESKTQTTAASKKKSEEDKAKKMMTNHPIGTTVHCPKVVQVDLGVLEENRLLQVDQVVWKGTGYLPIEQGIGHVTYLERIEWAEESIEVAQEACLLPINLLKTLLSLFIES